VGTAIDTYTAHCEKVETFCQRAGNVRQLAGIFPLISAEHSQKKLQRTRFDLIYRKLRQAFIALLADVDLFGRKTQQLSLKKQLISDG
jgi:hypothetical protein